MKISLQCISKNERLEGDATISDITLSPFNSQAPMGAMGAVVGTPNAPNVNQENLQQPQEVQYNINGVLSFTVRDEKEAQNFRVGKKYSISLDIEEAPSKPAK